MTIHIQDGANLRTIRELHVQDGATLRKLRAVYVQDGANLRQIWPGFQASLNRTSITGTTTQGASGTYYFYPQLEVIHSGATGAVWYTRTWSGPHPTAFIVAEPSGFGVNPIWIRTRTDLFAGVYTATLTIVAEDQGSGARVTLACDFTLTVNLR